MNAKFESENLKLRRSKYRWKYNIKTDLEEIRCENAGWTELVRRSVLSGENVFGGVIIR
jgi:hypothetical protein